MDPIHEYISEIAQIYAGGNATEHSYRHALLSLIHRLLPDLTATNEPKRSVCGAPDIVVSDGKVPVGHIEAKDVVVDLDREAQSKDQLQRYRESLPNLIFTNYLEFRWYVQGELDQTVTVAERRGGKIVPVDAEVSLLDSILQGFAEKRAATINTPDALANSLARLAHLIREIIGRTFDKGQASPLIKDLRQTLADILLPGLNDPKRTDEFADMFAQTLAYGLFAARCNHEGDGRTFVRHTAASKIPKTNPFLRKLFDTLTGVDLDDEPYASVVDTLVAVLSQSDMEKILRAFGQRTGRTDPILHFYETFLAAYDPGLREKRGVYYTPEPVVDYIVRSVDALLKERFGCPDGIADTTRIAYESYDHDNRPIQRESHKVLLLDPACGTGTFLYSIVDHIRAEFMKSNNAGMWSGYVKDHILPRLFGFELLMAPYAVAHLKLGMQLAGMDLPEDQRDTWSYDFSSDERIGVYLTNTLDEPQRQLEIPTGSYRVIGEEAVAANSIKGDEPIMVVLGNPPYRGHSANASHGYKTVGDRRKKVDTFIGSLVRDYYSIEGQPLGERNSKWLQDDYVKFIRWGTWRIQQSGGGILAFITNHGYLDNPTFRGMRYHLLKSFDDIYIVNLHGNSKKKEKAPDGGKDENVFNIQQGVAIGIFVKEVGSKHKNGALARVHHQDFWGSRKSKSKDLNDAPVAGVSFQSDLCAPKEQFFLMYPHSDEWENEVRRMESLTGIFQQNGWGIATRKDYLLVDHDRDTLLNRFSFIKRESPDESRRKFSIKVSPHWDFEKAIREMPDDIVKSIRKVTFRPFDTRFVYYERCMIERGDHRFPLMKNFFKDNYGLITIRRSETVNRESHFFCTNKLSVLHSTSAKEGNFVFPLYVYSEESDLLSNGDDTPDRRPNLNPDFVKDISGRLNLQFIPDGTGDLEETLGPEDIFHYMYAVFHSPTYRERYAEFLKIDFPRLPLTSDLDLFRDLCDLGRELVCLHLMETYGPILTTYPVKGDNVVNKVRFTDDPDAAPRCGRVWINKTQYFGGVPEEVWDFHIGGYQVCHKWLKDRKGRELSYDDVRHYCQIIGALAETIRLMDAIDERIPGWPLK